MNQDLCSTNWHITTLMSNFAGGRRRVAQGQTCSIAFNPITNWKARRFFNISDFRQTSAVPPWGFKILWSRNWRCSWNPVGSSNCLTRRLSHPAGKGTPSSPGQALPTRLKSTNEIYPELKFMKLPCWDFRHRMSYLLFFWRKPASKRDQRTAHAVSGAGLLGCDAHSVARRAWPTTCYEIRVLSLQTFGNLCSIARLFLAQSASSASNISRVVKHY
jgi:hypothetical protein